MNSELFTRDDLKQLTKLAVQIDNVMDQLKKLTKIVEGLVESQKHHEVALEELKIQVGLLQISIPESSPASGETLSSKTSAAKNFFTKNWYYILVVCGGSGFLGWFIDHLYYLYHLYPKK